MASTVHEAPRKKAAPRTTRARKATMVETSTPTHDEIALRARALYEMSGCPGGRDEEFWLEAERQLRGEANA